ncbi:eukaryotic translation initiation factor 5B [Punica granatum]|uniref:Uncharacterized protein n=2 Tax=Punica granatum TaxID=22663 RepID=A0A218W786_PUNGR|nr:eukaryotic translation initiation factor 5B [Punica granatum]XP_031386122.1 eukaryotic translation initiation factor 5B [Punica granatum]OWM67962.1 hypothetical protein CDL15_Pgr017530 [Punica granatum]PKI55899.1 hypothetical protein CRG98_023715 [Punica granatum]
MEPIWRAHDRSIKMKTVSGKIISTRSVSLAKASKILSKMVTVDNGASSSISIYLRKASDAFDELAQFHKGIKTPKSDRKSRKTSALTESENGPPQEVEPEDAESNRRKRRKKKVGDRDDEDNGLVTDLRGTDEQVLVNGDGEFVGSEGQKRKHKSKEKKAKDEVKEKKVKDESGDIVENTIENGGEVKGEDGNSGEAEDKDRRKKKKKEEDKKKKGGDVSISLGDNGFAVEEREDSKSEFRTVEENRDRGKKRKNEGSGEGREEDGLVEHRSKKKKRR